VGNEYTVCTDKQENGTVGGVASTVQCTAVVRGLMKSGAWIEVDG
jgi:hypothetical protein